MPSWTLEDADERAAKHPYTFFKSSREAISLVCPGEVVKLIFLFVSQNPEAPPAERMWVIVDELDHDGAFAGRLANVPQWIEDLELNDKVTFDARHIINTTHDNDDNIVERYIKGCFVTQRILEDGAKVGYMCRDEPEDEDDSGWCFTANDESNEYINDPKNIAYVPLGHVLSRDDSFIGLLGAPVGTRIVKDARTHCFVPASE